MDAGEFLDCGLEGLRERVRLRTGNGSDWRDLGKARGEVARNAEEYCRTLCTHCRSRSEGMKFRMRSGSIFARHAAARLSSMYANWSGWWASVPSEILTPS